MPKVAMWKQFINKLPRKSSKSIKYDPAPDPVWSNVATPGTAAKKMSSAIFPSSVVTGMEPLLSFKDLPDKERQNLFISKMNLCCYIFDFTNPEKDSADKDLKRRILTELVDYVSAETPSFTELEIAASCKMFTDNLCRVFPPATRLNSSGGENDEDAPVYDPAWWHLQVVYELLLKFIASPSLDIKFAKKYIDHSFILKLLDLFDSEDPRERDCLKTVLHRIYGKFMVHRPFIRQSVSNILYRFAFETQKHNGIAELLEVFGSVISGFALPLKEEHKVFLCRTLIPLHKPKAIGAYHQQLTYCLTQFVEKEPKLASTLIGGLLKYWPVTNSQKELMFLSELEEVLEGTNMVEFQKIMIPMLRRIACCINSSHFQVAERALFLWNNEHIVSLTTLNRRVILPLIFPALERNTRCHWNKAVLNATENVKRIFSEVDGELFISCQGTFDEEEEQRAIIEDKRRRTWEKLENAATLQSVQ